VNIAVRNAALSSQIEMLPYDWSDEPVNHLLAIEPLGQILSKHDT